ncbi:MAG: 50S ribosomal protein L13 [Treponema sp.]|nr:50S ribosomal protein L13 [Treponema sp.]MBR4630400.1 50S ribosomal protein L13 [Treponema sp.]MBR6912947.1 50S ribosomal protein L13 [Treponema sp.]MCR5126178.1 50S ribosomal protein L13 [Treponema sp.]
MKTIFLKDAEQKREWYVIDAAGKPLGRVAAAAAAILRGKNKPSYTPNQEMGDYVIIINAEKVAVSGNKVTDKLYRHYTGFVRGLRTFTFEKLIERKPTAPLVRTINGMLPNNRLGRKVAGNLKVYAGAEHPHASQNPKVVEL